MNSSASLTQIQSELSSGHLLLSDLVENYLQRIAATAHLNIFLEIYSEDAQARAKEIQVKVNSGSAGQLAGMVLAIKDNISYAHHTLSAASHMLEGFKPLFSATALSRLLEEDAIIIGRVNCDEFAMGGSNENSAFGAVKNPLNDAYVPGGSSGGSTAAVAAGCCLAALGSDTGGSIRQPASFCGVIGLKPTYGRVSRHGLIAFASSFDQISPTANHVADIAKIMNVMSGHDVMDNTSSTRPVETFNATRVRNTLKIGYIKECLMSDALDPEVKAAHNKLIDFLKSQGHNVEPVAMEELPYLVPTYYTLTTAEASSNLSRYDGIHFGYRSSDATDINSTYTKSRSQGFGPEVQRRIMLGTFVLSAGYYDAYYAQAQKVRRIIKMKTEALFSQFDLLLSPTTTGTAFRLGEKNDDPIRMYLEDIFTVHANLAGIPAISLPLFKHSNGLPFGTQFMAAAFQEEILLAFSDNLMNNIALER